MLKEKIKILVQIQMPLFKIANLGIDLGGGGCTLSAQYTEKLGYI